MNDTHSSNQQPKPAISQPGDAGRAQKPGLLYDVNRESQTPYKIPGVSGAKPPTGVSDRAGNGSQDREPGPRQRS